MNDKQLEIYTENLLHMAKAVQLAGGDVSSVLRGQVEFFTTLAKNGIRLKATLESAD